MSVVWCGHVTHSGSTKTLGVIPLIQSVRVFLDRERTQHSSPVALSLGVAARQSCIAPVDKLDCFLLIFFCLKSARPLGKHRPMKVMWNAKNGGCLTKVSCKTDDQVLREGTLLLASSPPPLPYTPLLVFSASLHESRQLFTWNSLCWGEGGARLAAHFLPKASGRLHKEVVYHIL